MEKCREKVVTFSQNVISSVRKNHFCSSNLKFTLRYRNSTPSGALCPNWGIRPLNLRLKEKNCIPIIRKKSALLTLDTGGLAFRNHIFILVHVKGPQSKIQGCISRFQKLAQNSLFALEHFDFSRKMSIRKSRFKKCDGMVFHENCSLSLTLKRERVLCHDSVPANYEPRLRESPCCLSHVTTAKSPV